MECRMPSVWSILGLATAIKVLLVPAYKSTDFEVHRNWMAITYSLPTSKWYTELTSEWTLDYPPFFAWFEWALAQAASWADPAMLEVPRLNYASHATVAFQRGSVIVSEVALLAAAWWACRSLGRRAQSLALALVALHPGLIMVDHIHFQYNGILLGIFVASMAALRDGQHLLGAALFAVLLNFKHIFLYAAPVYFVFLLRHYCRGRSAPSRFLLLGCIVAAVFLLSLGPFVTRGQAGQLASRLFPFDRGLVHAYWAPNFWALYAAADKVLAAAVRRSGRWLPPTARMTGGLVGTAAFEVLPPVGSRATALVTLVAMAPCLLHTWRFPNPARFPQAALHCTLVSFFFGYHVHEKAILMVLVPGAVFVVHEAHPALANRFFFLTTLGTYSLFPLLYRPEEYSIKVLLLVLYTASAPQLLSWQLGTPSRLHTLPGAYLWGLVGVEAASSWILPYLLGSRLPFLPLALVSCYCAVGIGAALIWSSFPYISPPEPKRAPH
ncbi:hypothetical protein APUTEX25_001109, partial [Auxenochlorella protothecoides]|uniref:Alpha-1,3-glucosyltransferase n=2 Tax=Auxenochlorella protothecoides TaxID=3075 RepID=A0A1D2AET5_AUXPR